MKQALLFLCSIATGTLFSQVQNGSFENNSGADLSHWEWTCNAQTYNSAPMGAGNHCIKVTGGNYQSCFPGYAYQKLPAVTNGQTFILSGWAYAETVPPVGIYFGRVNNGVVTRLTGDSTSLTTWTQLTVQSSFTLAAGDTAAVILYGGIASGPAQGYGYFDSISLQQVTGIVPVEQKQHLQVFPNPFNSQTTLQTSHYLHNATLTIHNQLGQTVKQINTISGQTVTLFRNELPAGLYFLRLSEGHNVIATEKLIIADVLR